MTVGLLISSLGKSMFLSLNFHIYKVDTMISINILLFSC